MSNITVSRLVPVTVDLTEKGRQALQAAELEAEICRMYAQRDVLLKAYHAAHQHLLAVNARRDFTEAGKAEWDSARQATQNAWEQVWAAENGFLQEP